MSTKPKLVVGLGNPGRDYVGTRHNIGFAVLDRLAGKFDCSFRRKWRFSAEVAEAAAGDAGKVVLAKPQTYMNRSGNAVNALLKWSKIESAQLLVVVDDADLPLGQIRLRASGGSGGHNGLRSIIEALGGNEEFARLRVGIGRSAPVGRLRHGVMCWAVCAWPTLHPNNVSTRDGHESRCSVADALRVSSQPGDWQLIARLQHQLLPLGRQVEQFAGDVEVVGWALGCDGSLARDV